MTFEFDYETLREREVAEALERSRAEAEYRKWVETKEFND